MDNKLEYENKYIAQGYKYIAGVDEVGRGPLAGPVVCAAVIMPLEEHLIIQGVDDSKKLSEKKREKLYDEILNRAIAVNICRVEHDEIDRINILNAVKKCMQMAIEGLKIKPDITLVDGNNTNMPINAEYIVKGDAKSYTIGCASIVAKVYRDRLMSEYDKLYPEYAFAKNKGYGTKVHTDAIRSVGLCPIHRVSFTKNFMEK